jgi:hypothetical protein
MGGRREFVACSEPPLTPLMVAPSESASVLGGVVLSEDVSPVVPRVVEERLVWRESSRLELELRFDFEVDDDIRRREWRNDGIAMVCWPWSSPLPSERRLLFG